MKILAIDTATEQLSLALWLDGTLTERTEPPGTQHSSLILPMIQTMMAEEGIAPSELSAIAYPIGPGAFTGLRIGCGIAQGLGFALGIPLVGISTLQAMAASVSGDQPIVVCLDARMGQVYTGTYQWLAGKLVNLAADRLANPSEVVVPTGGAEWVGNGIAAYREQFSPLFSDDCSVVDDARLPHARWFAQLAVTQVAEGQTLAAHEAGLVYLRDKVALTTAERAVKP